jgi:hypothetical protein
MNESLSFRTILTKVTFVTASVAYLMLDPTCSVLRLPLGTFIFAHVLVKCHLETFVALSWISKIFYLNPILRFAKPDSPILTDSLQNFFFGHTTILWHFSLQPKYILWDKLLCLLEGFAWSLFLLGGWEVSQCWALKALDMHFFLYLELINILIRCL